MSKEYMNKEGFSTSLISGFLWLPFVVQPHQAPGVHVAISYQSRPKVLTSIGAGQKDGQCGQQCQRSKQT